MKRLLYTTSAALFILVGCGGGGSGYDGAVKIITDADDVAYKSDNNNWSKSFKSTKNLTGNTKEYKIDVENRYKVALKCNNKTYYVAALSKKDDDTFSFNCPSMLISFVTNINGSIQDSVDGATNFVVANKTDYTQVTNSNTYNLSTENDKKSDILAITNINNTPKRFIALRDRTINSSNKTHNINFTNSNSATILSKAYNLIGQTKGRLILITKNRTYFTSSLGNKWYYPTSKLIDSDYYFLANYITNKKTFRVKSIQATKILKEDMNIDINYINPLNGLTYNGNIIGGLSAYIPNGQSETFRGYIVDLKDANSNEYHIMVSKGYLDGGDDYIIDDLSVIPGFAGSWNGVNANSVEAVAIMSDHKLGTLMEGNDYLHISKFENFPFRKNTTIEIAAQSVK